MAKAKKKKKVTKKKDSKRGSVARNKKPPRNSKGQLISGWGRGSKQIKKKKKLKAKKKIIKKNKPARRADGTLLPGNTANLAGCPKTASRLGELNAAIARVEEKKNKTFLDMCIEKAYKDTAMAVAILKKLHPDLRSIEQLNVVGDSMSEEEAEKIQQRIKERFE